MQRQDIRYKLKNGPCSGDGDPSLEGVPHHHRLEGVTVTGHQRNINGLAWGHGDGSPAGDGGVTEGSPNTFCSHHLSVVSQFEIDRP
jgi:hypothetical protein